MRWVFALLALGACESRYGTYFTVDGDSTEIHFDHVRLYFGSATDGNQIGKPSGATTGPVYERQFDTSDEFDVPTLADGSHATESTYWLPYSDANLSLAYVAAVAYDGGHDTPVGIGEVMGFKLERDVVDKYDIELQSPLFGVDVWGPAPGCLAWTRERDGHLTTVAVLPPDDSDCDGIVASADCNDLCPPDSPTCSQDPGVCGTPDTCGLGCAIQNTCTIATCMPDSACGTACASLPATPDARLPCAVDNTSTHLEINVDLLSNQPCSKQFIFSPYGRPCSNPQIEWADPRVLDGWTFQISEAPTGCVLSMDSPLANATFDGEHHLIVSFDPIPPSMSRWSLVVGVQPSPYTQCTAEKYHVTPGGTPFDCP